MALDEFPQWMNLTRMVEGTAGTAVEVSTNTNINRSDFNVMEILAIEYKFQFPSLNNITIDTSGRVQCSITTQTQVAAAIASLQGGTTIDVASLQISFQAFEPTETGGGLYAAPETILHDFASNGKGFLTAANIFFSQLDGITGLSTARVDVRVLHRLHKVNAAELTGLLAQLLN